MQGSATQLTTRTIDSPFRVVFHLAWRRLWTSPRLMRWEILSWSILAAHLGFDIFGYTFAVIDWTLVILIYILFILLTPIVTGGWINKVHAAEGLADESLRILPIRPVTVIAGRMLAVGLTWARLFAPLLILWAHLYNLNSGVVDPTDRWLTLCANHLGLIFMSPSLEGSVQLQELWWYSSYLYWLAAFQALEWVTLPLCWGFYRGSRLRKGGGGFLLGHLTYLILPAALVWLVYGRVGCISIHGARLTAEVFLFWANLVGWAGVTISAVLFREACWEWGRRAR